MIDIRKNVIGSVALKSTKGFPIVHLMNNSCSSSKRRFFLALLLFTISMAIEPEMVRAQSNATNYVWLDSIATSTTGRDSLFATTWEQVLIKPVGGAIYLKFGSPDTTSWSSRSWWYLADGEAIGFGAGTRLRRLQWKSVSGTITVYMTGYKKVAQF